MLLVGVILAVTFALCVRVYLLEKERTNVLELRRTERQGRIRAEIALREALKCQSDDSEKDDASVTYRRIGIVESCFLTRNGTPRQSLLVQDARARIVFESNIPSCAFEDLKGFSHVWIVYVFHKNTNLHHRLNGFKFKAKVQVPRLNGKKIGVFATRTPHRYNNIGLSVARLMEVTDRMIYIDGVDIIDGTPVLDIKPYIKEYDSVENAQTASWLPVERCSRGDALFVDGVFISPVLKDELSCIWTEVHSRGDTLCETFEAFFAAVRSSLLRDIRSVHQRLKVVGERVEFSSEYELLMDGVRIVYVMDRTNSVRIVQASCAADRIVTGRTSSV